MGTWRGSKDEDEYLEVFRFQGYFCFFTISICANVKFNWKITEDRRKMF